MTKLQKVLGFKTVLLITVNSIMGTGIYFLPAVGAYYGGPTSIISWIILSGIAIYISMCFAELVSMFPKAGGVYEYCKQAYGKFPSFIIGWITLLTGNITIAMLIVGGIQYLLPYPIHLPKLLLSLIFVFLFNYVAYKGMKTSAFMLITFSVITLSMVITLILPGMFKIHISNFKPFFVFPVSHIFLTLYFIQETFFGWESATFLAEETKDPERTMPKALILGTVIIAIIALSLVTTALGVIHWKEFGQSNAPLADLGNAIYGGIGRDIFTLWVYIAIVGAVACWVVSAPRLILALARDKLFLRQFVKIHPIYRTPYKAIFLQTIITSGLVLLGFGAYRTLLLLLIPLLLVMYSAVLFCVVLLRFKKPKLKRYFKVPFGKIGPLVIITIFILFLIIWFKQEENSLYLLRLASSLILAGIPIYLLLQVYYNPKFIRSINDILAYLTLWTEWIALPMSVRKDIINLLGNIKGKTILEFGCSVGTLTLHLAEEVGPDGKVYATDLSKHELKIAKKRLTKRGHKHVETIHDENHAIRVHPDVPKIHTIVSVGVIGYLQNIKRVLREMNKRLKIGSKICFVDYDKFFDVIPNVDWLRDDEKIKKIFEECGFKVGILRKQGFAWKYIYIYGTKVRDV